MPPDVWRAVNGGNGGVRAA